MKKLLLVLAISLFSLGINSQELINSYSSLLVELEQGVSLKEFKKAFKKQKSDWEASCSNAKEISQVSKLTVEFVSKVYEVKMLKAMLITTDNLVDQCNALRNIHGVLKTNDLSEWSESDHANWSKKLEDLLEKAIEQQKKIDAAKRAKLISELMVDFEKTFNAILEDSKKGSFANTIEGSKTDGKYAVKVKFKGGSNEQIVVDSDNIYEYQVEFDAGNDEMLAIGIQTAMIKVIESNVPEGYGKTSKYDSKFIKSEGYRFEFKAEKFALTAKQPSVLIGSYKGGSKVFLSISEPVFKR